MGGPAWWQKRKDFALLYQLYLLYLFKHRFPSSVLNIFQRQKRALTLNGFAKKRLMGLFLLTRDREKRVKGRKICLPSLPLCPFWLRIQYIYGPGMKTLSGELRVLVQFVDSISSSFEPHQAILRKEERRRGNGSGGRTLSLPFLFLPPQDADNGTLSLSSSFPIHLASALIMDAPFSLPPSSDLRLFRSDDFRFRRSKPSTSAPPLRGCDFFEGNSSPRAMSCFCSQFG